MICLRYRTVLKAQVPLLFITGSTNLIVPITWKVSCQALSIQNSYFGTFADRGCSQLELGDNQQLGGWLPWNCYFLNVSGYNERGTDKSRGRGFA